MSETFERDPKEDLKINRFSLETEAENQPGIYAYWSGELSKAKASRDRQKNVLEVLKAEKSKFYRDNLTKPTVDAVSNSVLCDPEVVQAMDVLTEAEFSVSMLYSTVGALEQKKSMLDNLVKLFMGQYFSKPSSVGNMGNTQYDINQTFANN